MHDDTDQTSLNLVGLVRANLVLILLLGAAGLALGLAAGSRTTTAVSATTPILLNPLEGNPFYPSSRGEQLVNLGSEAQALRSNAVAARVRELLGTEDDEAALLRGVRVGVPANTQILEVTYEAGSAATAIERSQAFADAYLGYRRERAEARIEEQTAQLTAQRDAATAELDAVAAQLAALASPDGADAQVLRQQSESLANQLNTLASRQAELSAMPLDPGQVITPASEDATGPVSTRTLLALAGLLGGLVAGVGIAVIRSVADPRVHSVEELEGLGVVVLGNFGGVPTAARSQGAADRSGVPGGGRRSEFEEWSNEVRKIRVAVLSREQVRPLAIMVSPTSGSADHPLGILELASSIARSGLDTIVVDATPHGEGPARTLGFGDRPGLSDILLGTANLGDTLVAVAPLLWILPPGEAMAEVPDLLVSETMERLVRTAKDRCDVVLVATESIQEGTAQSLANVVDTTVLEVEQHLTTRGEVRRTLTTLQVIGARMLGAVLLGPRAESRAQSFRPHLTVHQKALGVGTPELPPYAPDPGGGGGGGPAPGPDRPDLPPSVAPHPGTMTPPPGTMTPPPGAMTPPDGGR